MLPVLFVKNTGIQSAIWIAQTVPGVRAYDASASTRSARLSALTMYEPCTCLSQRGSCGSTARRRSRFARTFSSRSPVANPRFRLEYGPVLTPPARVVIIDLTRGGAGQSGTIQSEFILRSPYGGAAEYESR